MAYIVWIRFNAQVVSMCIKHWLKLFGQFSHSHISYTFWPYTKIVVIVYSFLDLYILICVYFANIFFSVYIYIQNYAVHFLNNVLWNPCKQRLKVIVLVVTLGDGQFVRSSAVGQSAVGLSAYFHFKGFCKKKLCFIDIWSAHIIMLCNCVFCKRIFKVTK